MAHPKLPSWLVWISLYVLLPGYALVLIALWSIPVPHVSDQTREHERRISGILGSSSL